MHHLSQIESTQVSAGSYFSSLADAFSDGIDESERALLVTGLGVGFVGGALLGRLAMILGAVTVGGYFAYDWIQNRG